VGGRDVAGFSLLELLVTVAVAGVLMAGLAGVVGQTLAQWAYAGGRQELLRQGHYALERMVDAVAATQRLLIPRVDDPLTGHDESLRDVLALTLDPALDRDGDGYADADNDRDLRVDEDIPADNNRDGGPGIVGLDDDGDGVVDEGVMPAAAEDNDEDGQLSEDWVDGVDNDGDGTVDEDLPKENFNSASGAGAVDNDGDGQAHEDWLDTVAFFVRADGTALMERSPNPGAVDGTDYSERPIAEAAWISLAVQRLAVGDPARGPLVVIDLTLSDNAGETLHLQARVRVGRDG